VRREVEARDRGLPVFALRSLDDVVAASVARRRVAMTLLAAFATLAALLAAVGLYGVVSQSARRRTKEIAVRVALGARRRDVGRLILNEGLALALAGGVLGLGAAAAARRLLSTLLFGVGPLDAATLAGSAALLGLVALLASLAPALAAARADPLVALRDER
jgi:ABC-type antimicrobial peptide transport system permease subunit